jgi:hypothetical protein
VADARDQLGALCKRWSSDADVVVCGSIATTGSLMRHSDIDFVCTNNPVGADRHAQLQSTEGLHRHLHRFFPSYQRRAFVALRTARTPVVRNGNSHEPPVKVLGAQAADGPSSLALVSDASDVMKSVAGAVSASKFEALTEEDRVTARTVLIHFKGLAIPREALAAAIKAAGVSADMIKLETSSPNVLLHPMGYDPASSVAQENQLGLQAMAAAAAQIKESTLATVVGHTELDALRLHSVFPDGECVPRSKRDAVTTDAADRRKLPALLRFQWDVSFAGYSATNSYLLRAYLSGPGTPAWARHAWLGIKRWAARSRVSEAAVGLLTPYAVSVMWAYYLLGGGHVPWLSPASIPVPAELPLMPPRSELCGLSNVEAELAALHTVGFFKFYSSLQLPSVEPAATPSGFLSDREVVSLNRPRRSLRTDMGWDHGGSGRPDMPGFLLCIEDPYELVGQGGLNLGRHLSAEKIGFINQKTDAALRRMLLHEPDGDMDCGLLGRSVDPEPSFDE